MTVVWRVWFKELKEVNWKKVLNGRIPMNRKIQVDGKFETKTEWLNFSLWGKSAESFDRLIEKWMFVNLVGSLQKNVVKDEVTDKNKEYVNLKVSSFNLYGRSALYFNDTNSVDLEWNVASIQDDMAVWEDLIRKRFSVAVNNDYNDKDWNKVEMPANFWNVEMLIPKSLGDTFKERFIKWRSISLNGMLTFYETKEETPRLLNTIKVNDFKNFRWMFLKKWESIESQNEQPASEIEIDVVNTEVDTYKDTNKKVTKERSVDEVIEETEDIPFPKSNDNEITVEWNIPKKSKDNWKIKIDEDIEMD